MTARTAAGDEPRVRCLHEIAAVPVVTRAGIVAGVWFRTRYAHHARRTSRCLALGGLALGGLALAVPPWARGA